MVEIKHVALSTARPRSSPFDRKRSFIRVQYQGIKTFHVASGTRAKALCKHLRLPGSLARGMSARLREAVACGLAFVVCSQAPLTFADR